MPTFNEQISVTADDGGWVTGNAGSFNNSANTVDLGRIAGSQGNGFFHFPSITIPNGSTINSASITIRPNVNQPGVGLTISGEKAANPAAVASQADGDGRVHTTATVSWITTFSSGSDDQSTDLKTIIQEIVNQGGWASGNALQLFIAQSGFASPLTIVGEDGTHPAGRAVLTINYGTAGTAVPGAAFWLFDES